MPEVTLDRLFRPYKEIELPDGRKGFARALGDAEVKERRRWALLQAAAASKDIENEDSEEYQLVIAPLATIEDPLPLIATILQVRTAELRREAEMLSPYPVLPIPDNADDVKEREVLAARTEAEERVDEERETFIKARLTEIRNKLVDQDVAMLQKMATNMAIILANREAMFEAIRWYTVYAGAHVYLNGDTTKSERLYQSPEEAKGAPPTVVDKLYLDVVELNDVNPWEIAKNA